VERETVAGSGEGRYRSLYRRFRPQRFADLRGQDLVATTLRNAVRDGRTVHAYLFSGPRGTGKTSTARILAKALNCEQPEGGEPCGRCSSCVSIASGSSLDVIELDAASNNGVEAMRELVARTSLATPGERRVYIIDEVHMLSAAASNTLLKTLEEPPAHVAFVLATTDPQKVLPTIRSRTQHFEFRLFEQSVLQDLLSDVAREAALELPEDAIEAAARRGRGSARDALSALDQVAASGTIEPYETDVAAIVEAIAVQDAAMGLKAVGEAIQRGIDPQRLAGELVEALREQFLAGVALQGRGPADGGEGYRRLLLPPARCTRALELVGKAIVDMKEALDPRTTLDVAVMRVTHPGLDDDTTALLDRIERLERRLADLEQAGGGRSLGTMPPRRGPDDSTDNASARPALGAYAKAARSSEGQPPPLPTVGERNGDGAAADAPSDMRLPTRDDLVTAWADSILPALKPRARAVYAVGRWIAMRDGTAVFALPNEAHVEHASPLRGDVAHAISAHFGAAVSLELVSESGAEASIESGQAQSPAEETAPSTAKGAGPVRSLSSGGEPDDSTTADGCESPLELEGALGEPHDPASWAEERLREVFPGAEEVS
jgi:DNA polymerase-3 subunit gamma/tau